MNALSAAGGMMRYVGFAILLPKRQNGVYPQGVSRAYNLDSAGYR